MDKTQKIVTGIVMVIPMFAFVGALFGIFNIWMAFFLWVVNTAALLGLFELAKRLTCRGPWGPY